MKKQNKFFLADLHTKGKKEGVIEGIASTWNKDLGGDQIEQGAFSDTIPNFMKNPVMLFSHQMDKPIGKWTKLTETDRGLEVSGQINTNTVMGKEVNELIKNDDVKGLSIGYSEEESEAVGGTNVLKRLNLWEISIVSIPMNQEAWLVGAKMFNSKEEPITKLDDNSSWREVATAMYLLQKGKFQYQDLEDKEPEFNIIAEQYKRLEKKLPKDDEFKEDEQYQYELTRFKNNVINITDIVKHWNKKDRELPETDLTELYELLDKRIYSKGVELEAIQQKRVQAIDKLITKVDGFNSAISEKDRQDKIKRAEMLVKVDDMLKGAFYKATGKRI